MICIVRDITSVNIDGVEYKSEDSVIEIPDEKYRKIVHHPYIRTATSREIESLRRIKAEKAAAEAAAQKAAEEEAAKEAEAAVKKAAAKKAAEQAGKEDGAKGGAANGGK